MSRNHGERTEAVANLDLRLSVYSIAAAAAGVSVLAAATPAAAKVVVTKTSTPIPACDVFFPCPVYLDLNNDGTNDFEFNLYTTDATSFSFWRRVSVAGLSGADVMEKGGKKPPFNQYNASCLVQGAKIGPSAHFEGGASMEISHVYSNSAIGKFSRHLYGNWGGSHANRFLGVKFNIDGATHYGWIRVKVESNSAKNLSATITEYGYETVANKTLDAGDSGTDSIAARVEPNGGSSTTASLGALAAGVDGLSLWRREESLSSN